MAGRWTLTSCGLCYVGCGIRVLVENGVVVDIEGDTNNPQNRGKMCAKGKAGVMNLYNPHRVKAPLKRSNPRKGLDVDPGWQEVSWEEALGTIAGKLKEIKDDPKKLYIQGWEVTGDTQSWLTAFGGAFGTPHIHIGTPPTCGKVIHPVEHFSGGGFHQQPDLHYCNYLILVGTQFAIATRCSFNHIATDMAEARARGMKLVAIDPVGGYAASKADEWIPIRPGTDTALALAMLHVLVNELGIYDAQFLKGKTNAPYLVGPSGLYIRDPASGKPLLYDLADGAAKAYDDLTLRDPAISGSYEVEGEKARPTFELLREHVANYPPERAQEITTIPAGTIRRIAREFGEAAQVGATITIDGVELPYRPACVDWAKGTQGHKHAFHQSWPLKLLNMVVGAVNVPGAILSTAAKGKTLAFSWGPAGGTDGLLEEAGMPVPLSGPTAFPGRTPTPPLRMDLAELFPVGPHTSTLFPIAAQDPQRYGLSYQLEVMLHSPTNTLLGAFGDIKMVERFYQSIDFIAGFAMELNETSLFDDIVLPFPSYLETLSFFGGSSMRHMPPCGKDDFFWQIRQAVVEPPPGVRQPLEVLTELADRVGILAGFYRLLNHAFRFKEPYALEPGRRYGTAEVVDRAARCWFGEECGLAWFREHGVIRYPRDVDEAYIGPFLDARIPVYLEHFLSRGAELKEVVGQMGLEWDLSDYKPLSEWQPCPSYEALQRGEYDLVAVHYKLPFVYGSFGNENPWINEICERNPYAYAILLNEDVARRKRIKDGDEVWLESPVRKVRAKAKLTQCIHPEVVGVAGHFGHFSPGMPIAKGKGISFHALLPMDLDHIDKISTALEYCVEVKVYK